MNNEENREQDDRTRYEAGGAGEGRNRGDKEEKMFLPDQNAQSQLDLVNR